VLAVLIKLDSKGPVFFKQKRIGKDKVVFDILKFRTMRTDTPKDMPTHLLNNPEAFITKLGKFLRKSSLDELPQLINIAKGEMSFVGPRPALWNQYDLITLRDKYYANSVRPGLTGWAQVNGRDELPIEVKARLDGEYICRKSIGFDVYVLFKTFVSVIRSEGVKEGSK
jgi:O-antigen biosynthesis protein WbqP